MGNILSEKEQSEARARESERESKRGSGLGPRPLYMDRDRGPANGSSPTGTPGPARSRAANGGLEAGPIILRAVRALKKKDSPPARGRKSSDAASKARQTFLRRALEKTAQAGPDTAAQKASSPTLSARQIFIRNAAARTREADKAAQRPLKKLTTVTTPHTEQENPERGAEQASKKAAEQARPVAAPARPAASETTRPVETARANVKSTAAAGTEAIKAKPAPTKARAESEPVKKKSSGALEQARKEAAREAKAETPAAEPAPQGPSCDLNAAPKGSHLTQIFYTILLLVLFAGWMYSGEEIITAKEGAGYYIGIIGGLMMFLLIIYPLRKTARFMRNMGAIRHWFRAHMILGLIGPLLIIFHANFEVGSMNSTVALTVMLIVAVSGLVGRHIYAGIHYGLYGKEMDLKGLKEDFEHNINGMKYILDYAPALQNRLKDFDSRAANPHYSFVGSLYGIIKTFLGALWVRLVLLVGLRRTLRVAARRNKWSQAELKEHKKATKRYISSHIAAAKAIARFKVYERLFSLWHLLHMPLFLMLVLTAIIHVVAVHMF